MKFLLFIAAVAAQLPTDVQCPKLDCSEEASVNLEGQECFRMQRDKQEQTIFAKECYDQSLLASEGKTARFCPFNLFSNQYAWINETIPFNSKLLSLTSIDDKTSQFKDRMLTAECLNSSALVQNLLPGRQCSYHF